jgi:hypothetical protein
MSKHYRLMLILVILSLSMVIHAQEGAPNWCDAPDGRWYYGDGLSRCNTQPTPADNLNMWFQGFYGAQYEAGDITLNELFVISAAAFGNIVTEMHPELLVASMTSGNNTSDSEEGSGSNSNGGSNNNGGGNGGSVGTCANTGLIGSISVSGNTLTRYAEEDCQGTGQVWGIYVFYSTEVTGIESVCRNLGTDWELSILPVPASNPLPVNFSCIPKDYKFIFW